MKQIALVFALLLTATPFFAQPIIGSFSPGRGIPGTAVTIKGTGFSSITDGNTVYFGAVKATVLAATDTSLIVSSPAAATFQPITVTVNGLTAYSGNEFLTSFAGDTGSFQSSAFLPKTDLSAGIYPHSVSLADFNGDGKSDLLITRGSSRQVTVFQNTGINGQVNFAVPTNFAANGDNHEAAATGDLDGDGKLDFVITNTYPLSGVSVYRNTSVVSAISFADKIDYPADNDPYGVAIGDIDGDGKPDLAIANGGGTTINIYLNTSVAGNISFSAMATIAAGSYPFSIALADLNGDGKPEMVYTTQGGNASVFVMKNKSTPGSLNFDSPLAIAPGVFVVCTGDIDGDGKPDIAAANGGSLTVVRNTSSVAALSFNTALSFTGGNYADGVALADLNGDGKPEMLSADRFSNSLSVLKNTSVPGNISFEPKFSFPAGNNPLFVAAGDLNGDGKPEMLVANSSSDLVTVYQNISGANIAPVVQSFTPGTGISGTSVSIGGSNFTGATSVQFGGVEATSFHVDSATGITAIVGPGASGSVAVTTASGTGSKTGFVFTGPVITSFSPTIGAAGTTVLITGTNFTGASAVQFGGTPAASFTVNSSTSITAVTGPGSSGSVTVTTPNGTASLAGFSFGAPTIGSFSPVSAPAGATVTINGTNFDPLPANNTVLFGAVKATVVTATTTKLTAIVPAGATYKPIQVTVNHLTAYSSLCFISSFTADSLSLSANQFVAAGNYGNGGFSSDIAIQDLNNDGKPDLVIVNTPSNSITVYQNASIPSSIILGANTDYTTGANPKQVATGDLDGDGQADLAVSNFNAGGASTVSIFRNTSSNGNISLSGKTDISCGDGALGVFIRDMDGDGRPDLMVSGGNSGFTSFFRNISVSPGSIVFAPKQTIQQLSHADHIIAADLDNDGRPELISSNFSGNSISVFRNTSSGGVFSLSGPTDYAAGSNPSFISAVDLNGDGRLDIALSNYSDKNMSFYRNNSSTGFISLSPKQDYAQTASNIDAGDLNGDGKPDLCNGIPLKGTISLMANTTPSGNSFSFLTTAEITTGAYDTYTASGDLDGDGKPELVVINTSPGSLLILTRRGPAPVIDSVSALNGHAGDSINIYGRGFGVTTAVKFGGTQAKSYTVWSSTKITAIAGAGASGNITVTTSSGTASISGFSFIPDIKASGPTDFCSGGSVVLTSSAEAGNRWYKDGVFISSANGSSYTAVESAVYTLTTTSSASITTASATAITVHVIEVPTPVISAVGNGLLASSATAGNQWYLDGQIIPGATAATYQATQSGSYTVRDSASGCLSNFSAPYQLVVTGVADLGNNQFIKLYPNPVQNVLHFNWNANALYELHISVTNAAGKLVVPDRIVRNNASLDLSLLAQGVYFIKLGNQQLRINQSLKLMIVK